MTSFKQLFILVLTFVALLSSCGNEEKRPNMVLIMADDLGYECLGCNGGESYRTPHLDRMAMNGIRYTNCFSQPLCTPSRVQIMTGKYNHRNYKDFGILVPGERTFAHALQDHGYATLVVGKWQLFGSNTDSRVFGQGTFPTDAGFDEYCLWQIDQTGSRYADPLIHWNDTVPKVFEGRYGPDVFFSYIREFLERTTGRPFLLYYPMALPHGPFEPTPSTAAWDTARGNRGPQYFGDMVTYMDKIVGQIVDELKTHGLWEDTYVFFTGDNGTDRRIESRFNGRTIKGNKGIPSYYGTHVPLIVAGGPVSLRGVVDDLVDFSDFYPTLCGLAGMDLDGWTGDGMRFDPSFTGGSSRREWIYCWYHSGKSHLPTAVFVQDYRFKVYEDGGIYDIASDQGEGNVIEEANISQETLRRIDNLQTVLENFRNDSL